MYGAGCLEIWIKGRCQLKITIAAVGKLKEKYWEAAIAEYSMRLSAYAKVTIIEISEEKAPEKLSGALMEIIKQKEGARLLAQISDRAFFTALCVDGKKISSEGLSAFMQDSMTQGTSEMVFGIGGSLGLSAAVLQRANARLSFSDMTFPHQLMRVLLLEQIYRGFKIMRAEPYHK